LGLSGYLFSIWKFLYFCHYAIRKLSFLKFYFLFKSIQATLSYVKIAELFAMDPERNMKKTVLLLLTFSTLLQSHLCENRLFNISSTKDSRVIDFVEQITEFCKINLIIGNSLDNDVLEKSLNRVYIREKNLLEVLDLFLYENNIFYELRGDILRISYVKTETFHIDYISSQRDGSSKTEVTIGSEGSGGNSGASGGKSTVGSIIESKGSFNFWENLQEEITQLLTRPEDNYSADAPIINEKAGLVTVSGTLHQLQRVEEYIRNLEKKLQKQVLIDVNILSVSLNKNSMTGINWDDFYGYVTGDGVTPIKNISSTVVTTASVEQILRFLRQKGKVKSISNPKIVAINNQQALISVGNEYFYSIKSTQITDTDAGTSNTFNSTEIQSVFAGILLDITAEISDDDKITLNINPSISQTIQTISSEETREVPPDLTKKQLSSVVITEDGKRVILGGLITKSTTVEESVVPLLGYIPILGAFFRSNKNISNSEELIIVITPHILRKENRGEIDTSYKFIVEKK
jgi:general secretion pathway protein D